MLGRIVALVVVAGLTRVSAAAAQETAPGRTAVLTYTITMTGEDGGPSGDEASWKISVDRVLKARVLFKFDHTYSTDGDVQADSAARAARQPPPRPQVEMPKMTPALMDAMRGCLDKEPTVMMTCAQEFMEKSCSKGSGEDKESACAIVNRSKQAKGGPDVVPEPPPPPIKPLERSGEFWKSASCEQSVIVRDRTVHTIFYDPLTRGPFVTSGTREADWSDKAPSCGRVEFDKLAKTARITVGLPEKVPTFIRSKNIIQTFERKEHPGPFDKVGLPGNGFDLDMTIPASGVMSLSGSGIYKPNGRGPNSTIQSRLEWSLALQE